MHKSKFILIFLLYLYLSIDVYAQKNIAETPSFKTKGVSLGLGGTSTLIGISYDQMISKKIQFEMGLGINNAGVAVKYYLTDTEKRKFNYYVGTSFLLMYYSDGAYYFPIGMTYFSKKNFYHSFEVGFTNSFTFPEEYPYLIIGLKTGYRFGNDIKKIKSAKTNEYKNIISGSIAGITPLIGIVYERLLNSYLSCEIELGTPLSFGTGIKLNVPRMRVGYLNAHVGCSFYFNNYNTSNFFKIYFPVGINILSNKRYKLSLDAGPKIDLGQSIDEYNLPDFTFNIKYGYAF